jgi:crossover junction endodeoxyribonuclease RusA
MRARPEARCKEGARVKPITFTIDAPPSVNKVWRHAGKRVFRDPRYVAWQRTAGWEITAKRPGRFSPGTKVAVTVKAGKPKRARDLDNYGKGILDLMQSLGIIDNDRNVADLRLAWDSNVEPGRVVVEIKEIERAAA